MDKWVQKKKILKEVFWFLLKFNLFLIPYYAVIYFDINFYPLQELLARVIGSILRLLGSHVVVYDFLIYVEDLVIDISRDCVGWKSAYSLLALVLASPGKLKDKLRFLCLWIPVFLLFNIFRILITIVVGLKFGANYLELFHNIVWQEVIVVGIIGAWYLWLRKVKKLNKEKQ